MKKFLVLICVLALVPVVVPARAHALTLAQRVSRVEAKLNCLTRTPVYEYAGYAWYGTDVNGSPAAGPNGQNTYVETSGNPDSLTDQGWYFGLDWYFPSSGQPQQPPDYWVMAIKTSPTTNQPIASCVSKFAKTPTPTWWGRSLARMRVHQLGRLK